MATATTGPAPTRCYCSCAPQDKALRDELLTVLAPWVRDRPATVWHRDLLPPGAPVQEALEQLMAADLVLLLMSADYTADATAVIELDAALARHALGKGWAIPVMVRPFLRSSTPVRDLAVLPGNGQPVTSWSSRDEAWVDVAAGVERAALALAARPEAPARTERLALESIAGQLATSAEATQWLAASGTVEIDCSAAAWESRLFDCCSRGDAEALERLAAAMMGRAPAEPLKEVARFVRARTWPPGMAQTLLHLQRDRSGWRAEVRLGFLGHVCSVQLRPGERVPLGVGGALETEAQDGDLSVRLVASSDSVFRGTRARIRAGLQTVSQWLLPGGTAAMGGPDETVLFEMTLSATEERGGART